MSIVSAQLISRARQSIFHFLVYPVLSSYTSADPYKRQRNGLNYQNLKGTDYL